MDTALASVLVLFPWHTTLQFCCLPLALVFVVYMTLVKSGWMLLISLIPFGIIYVYLLARSKGDEGDNQYGSPVSYETITAEEAARTGFKETPTEDMDASQIHVRMHRYRYLRSNPYGHRCISIKHIYKESLRM